MSLTRALLKFLLGKRSEIEVRCLLLPWLSPRSMPHRFTIFINHLIKILPRYLIGKSCLPRGNVNKATKLLEYCCHVNISNCLLWCNFSILYWYDIGFYAGSFTVGMLFIKCLFFWISTDKIIQGTNNLFVNVVLRNFSISVRWNKRRISRRKRRIIRCSPIRSSTRLVCWMYEHLLNVIHSTDPKFILCLLLRHRYMHKDRSVSAFGNGFFFKICAFVCHIRMSEYTSTLDAYHISVRLWADTNNPYSSIRARLTNHTILLQRQRTKLMNHWKSYRIECKEYIDTLVAILYRYLDSSLEAW